MNNRHCTIEDSGAKNDRLLMLTSGKRTNPHPQSFKMTGNDPCDLVLHCRRVELDELPS